MKFSKNDRTLKIIKRWIWTLLIVFSILECIYYGELKNIFGCFTLIYGWTLISTFVLTERNFLQLLLPTFILMGYGICYCFLPLLITYIEGKPLTYLFQIPYETFFNQILLVTTMVIAFRLCRRLYKPNNIINHFFNKIGYFTIPNEKQVWILALVGLFGLLSRVVTQGSNDHDEGNGFIIRTLNIVSLYSTFPICLYFKSLYGETKDLKSIKYVKYYIFLLIIIGISTTRRALIFNCVISIVFIYILLHIIENRRLFTFRNTFIVVAGFYLATGPIADLAIAMALNRHLAESSSASKTFDAVIDLYKDKERMQILKDAIRSALNNDGDNTLSWDEYYVDNIFLDRWCNLRVQDATIFNAHASGLDNPEAHKLFKEMLINQIPSIFTTPLGIEKVSREGTLVDHMLSTNFVGDERYAEFGLKVGGDSGIGLYTFGYKYYFIALFIFFIVFYFLSTLIYTSDHQFIVPVPILASLMTYFMFTLNADGIFTTISYISRNFTDSIFIYCILRYISSLIFKTKQNENRNYIAVHQL